MRKKSVAGAGAAGGGGCGAGTEEEEETETADGGGDEKLRPQNAQADAEGDGDECATESDAQLETASTAASNCESGPLGAAGSDSYCQSPIACISAALASPFASDAGADE